ncbi:prolyl oligopeptidase family serine peptidase [Oceanirhabdus seepicola]|uniref:Prolyl oligopeptidase family serine peptidase n=1 Tax=Oceanirhabdus seepicola TaxID=2828781 RepID=A0A9J6NXD5_9CLOT|nr:prolyl oligopeptidase family serine peptidase [Oceanirhabdus seepicola]MCM1988923.1 prolyl oligopeptidase family serine peptidase [Oceanirhabdus seepicola]
MIEVTDMSYVEKRNVLNYIVNLPDNYDEKKDESFPVILFLHGIGERGNDINLVKKYGIHRYAKEINIPFIIVSPQCHSNNFWGTHINDIELLLKDIKSKYNADISKICLVGISLGAYGAWNFAMQRPELFSSIVSVAGGAMLPKYANLISHIPSYIVHGELDTAINVKESLEIADALKEVGGKVELVIIPDMGHEACTKIFESDELYKWIEENTK